MTIGNLPPYIIRIVGDGRMCYTILNTKRFHELFNRKFGVETIMVDMADLDAVKQVITPGTRLVGRGESQWNCHKG